MPRGKLRVDEKEWKKVKRRLTVAKKQVDIGWFNVNYSADNNYLPVAQVAKWNEEGHRNGGMFAGTITPPRPFIRTLFMHGMEAYMNDNAARLCWLVGTGKKTWQEVHEEAGKAGIQMMKDSIDVKQSPKNSPLTIEIKGFNNPLIESGYMKDTVAFRVKARRKTKS